MTGELKQFVPSHRCLACEGCCRFQEQESVWQPKALGQEAQKEVRGSDKKIFSKDVLTPEGRIKTLPDDNGRYICLFFTPKDHTCQIYSQRPFECQLYPFILKKTENQMVLCVHLSCPYVQEVKDTEIFGEYVSYLRKYFAQEKTAVFCREVFSRLEDYAGYDQELAFLFELGDSLHGV